MLNIDYFIKFVHICCLYIIINNYFFQDANLWQQLNSNKQFKTRRILRVVPSQITKVLKADILWRLGITGRKIKP